MAYQTVAPEAVWQVGRPPYQSKIWYGGAIPIRDAGISLVLIPKNRYSITSFFLREAFCGLECAENAFAAGALPGPHWGSSPVAPEAVWQVWRPPYQSEIWYGGAITIRDAGISLVLIPKIRCSIILLSFYFFTNYFY